MVSCTNVATGTDNFIMSSSDYLNIKKQADIFAIVHSHPDESNEASQYDIDCCNVVLYHTIFLVILIWS